MSSTKLNLSNLIYATFLLYTLTKLIESNLTFTNLIYSQLNKSNLIYDKCM
jgi:hypothetical protein